MKRKKKNADIEIIDGQTGMSQQEFFQYIDTKRSTLTHHLVNIRLLSKEAGLKLVNLTVKLVQQPQQSRVQPVLADKNIKL